MSRHLILHIGTTKTGSTSIQNVLHAARASLPAQGAYYPDTDTSVTHQLMAAAFTFSPHMVENTRNRIWQGRDPKRVLADYIERFKKEMEALPPEISRVILSEERFARFVKTPEKIKEMRDLLAPYFDDIKVVVYLRRQDAHFASSHAQTLRMGRIEEPDISKLDPWYHDYDYADLLGRWAEVYGESAIRPFLFEKMPNKKFDVVAEFLEFCGLTLPPESDEALRARNLSMNRTGQRVLTEIGTLVRKQHARRDLASGSSWKLIASSVSRVLEGRGWQPTQVQAKTFMAQFAETNEQVRRRWFPERDSLFSTDFSNLPESEPVIDYEAEFRSACAVVLEVANEAMRRQQQTVKMKSRRASKAKDTDKLRATLMHAIKLDGSDMKSRLQLARLQINDGALQSARHHLKIVLKQRNDHPIARRLSMRLERLDERQEKKANKAAEKQLPPPYTT